MTAMAHNRPDKNTISDEPIVVDDLVGDDAYDATDGTQERTEPIMNAAPDTTARHFTTKVGITADVTIHRDTRGRMYVTEAIAAGSEAEYRFEIQRIIPIGIRVRVYLRATDELVRTAIVSEVDLIQSIVHAAIDDHRNVGALDAGT